jgi:hypothetical protein
MNRFHAFTLHEQLGHIGAEISRIRFWDERGQMLERNGAFERAVDLIDLTLTDARWRKSLKELARLREVLADTVKNSRQYGIPLKSLENYCLDFALSARRT